METNTSLVKQMKTYTNFALLIDDPLKRQIKRHK